MAKGMIDDDHPLALGCIERACRQVQRRLLRSADLIVGIGYDTVEVEYEAWIADVPLLQIDIEAADVAPAVDLRHQVIGDLDHALARLVELPALRNGWASESLADHRRSFQQSLRPQADGFTAHAAIDAVRRALPPEGILAFDVGAHTHQIASQWAAHAPKTFHITNGWSSMGFGLPAAIAAKLARPDLPVVCLIGDGCFQMTCGEVAVAKRLGLNLPVVVLDDRWLALIKVKQIRRQFPLYGTALQEEDYREPPAHYFGVPALGVKDARSAGGRRARRPRCRRPDRHRGRRGLRALRRDRVRLRGHAALIHPTAAAECPRLSPPRPTWRCPFPRSRRTPAVRAPPGRRRSA